MGIEIGGIFYKLCLSNLKGYNNVSKMTPQSV